MEQGILWMILFFVTKECHSILNEDRFKKFGPINNQKNVYSAQFTDKLRRIFRNAYPYKSILTDQLKQPGPMKQTVFDVKGVEKRLKNLKKDKVMVSNLMKEYKEYRNSQRTMSYSASNCTRDYDDYIDNLIWSIAHELLGIGDEEMTERTFGCKNIFLFLLASYNIILSAQTNKHSCM